MKKNPQQSYGDQPGKVNARPPPVQRKWAPRGKKMTSAVAIHEAGHVLVGLKTGRELLQVWVRGDEGCVEFEPFRWFPGGVARIRRGLAVDVAGHLAEDLAAGCNRDRLSRTSSARQCGIVVSFLTVLAVSTLKRAVGDERHAAATPPNSCPLSHHPRHLTKAAPRKRPVCAFSSRPQNPLQGGAPCRR
jgi:hypothetical protein